MNYDSRREILERLERLERMVRSRHDDRGGGDRDRRGGRDRDHRDRRRDRDRDQDGGDEFQEKRIIDTIVRLVGEQIGRMLEDQQAKTRGRDQGDEQRQIIEMVVRLISERIEHVLDEREQRARAHEHHNGHHDGGDEKRVVDLIVGLVSEHVREIVATELDRRLGRPDAKDAGSEPAPSAPRGGAPDGE